MIIVFGSVNVDLVCRAESIPAPGETVLAPRYEMLSGGKGANQAVAAARAGAEVVFVGAVGHDAFGDREAEALASEGIDIEALAKIDEPTGCAFITVDGRGENAITVASGANRLVKADNLKDPLQRRPSHFVLQMELPFGETVAAAELAKRNGVRVILNLAPVPADADAEALRSLFNATDVLIVNEHELAEAAGILGRETTLDEHGEIDAGALATSLARNRTMDVLATLGSKGALIARADGTVASFPAPSIEPVDTTGAGDTLCGVFAAELDAGLGTEEAVHRAVAAASIACLAFGARSAMPRGADIDAAVAAG